MWNLGDDIASTMRRRIGRHKNYNVVGSQETNRLMTGETIDNEFLADMEELTRLGGYFDVDGANRRQLQILYSQPTKNLLRRTLFPDTKTVRNGSSGLYTADIHIGVAGDNCRCRFGEGCLG